MDDTSIMTTSVENVDYHTPGVWYCPPCQPFTLTPIVYYPSVTVLTTPAEPLSCSTRVHVFECAHAKRCKCGAVKRRREVHA